MTARIARTLALAVLLPLLAPLAAGAGVPTVAELDANQRAAGNRLDVAVAIGRSIFSVTWP
ncbi:MAG: hypothetical protein JO199_08305, partial [Candidatus Eremiobacteraeota bacterium]|nr:hypothetical protein [Candidatus Eremiobacteraeota bacterium]